MGAQPSFYHRDGTIFRWADDGRDCEILDAAQVMALRAEISTAARAAYRAGDKHESLRQARLWMELTQALDSLDAYRRGATLGFTGHPNGYAIKLGAQVEAVIPTFAEAGATMTAAREANAMLAACLAMAPSRRAA
jgi:hypothetical protein